MSGDHFLNLQPGTVVNDRYEVVKCLGAGSMGMVYACRHLELAGHIVAMKVLFAEVARDEIASQRFKNEIVASYEVSHPNVVRAYEYFKDGEVVAFTMEYIGGGDLADRINTENELTIEEIVRMLTQMTSGVQAIHNAGIIHRDLKPENILLTSQGNVKITDFGIARHVHGPKLTEHGGVVGTIDYVSPEYLEQGTVDARSDIYALGVLAYEMITGELPFKGKSLIETMTLRLRTDPEPPHTIRKDCPDALSAIVLKAMNRDNIQRYQTAQEMNEDLESLKFYMSSGKSTPPPPVRKTAEEISKPKPQPKAVVEETANGMMGMRVESGSDEPLAPPLAASWPGVVGHDSLFGADLDEYSLESRSSVYHRPKSEKSTDVELDEKPVPSVAVSRSSLTTKRIKELADDLSRTERSSFRSIFTGLVVLCTGIVFGLLIVKHYWPEPSFEQSYEGEQSFEADLEFKPPGGTNSEQESGDSLEGAAEGGGD